MKFALKKLDQLLITSFIPPFVVTFFIALFVFVMQTLWLYIDDIAGKGVGFLIIVELVAYLSVSMIPMALPVAVLISSVMVLGNLAENYELSSIKSAGISLWRVMRPLMVITFGISVFSYFCSNNFIPVSNLKFKSRLYDIRHQKPTLNLEESVFNADFQGYSIRIGDKLPDGRRIKNVSVYDNSESHIGRLQLVTADSGIMYGSADRKFFIMELYDGYQYIEPKPVIKAGRRNYPLMRASFKTWTKVFDLDEFELSRTDPNLFRSHHTMLTNRQLLVAIDSIDAEKGRKLERLADSYDRNLFFWNKASLDREREKRRLEDEKRRQQALRLADSLRQATRTDTGQFQAKNNPAPDSSHSLGSVAGHGNSTNSTAEAPAAETKVINLAPVLPGSTVIQPTFQNVDPATIPNRFLSKPSASKSPETAPPPPVIIRHTKVEESRIIPQQIEKPLREYTQFNQLFTTDRQREMLSKASINVNSLLNDIESARSSIRRTLESRVKHVFEFHAKFSMAVACFIFLFVGAPMGAIVRKGGFGWPMLISVIFFVFFIIISIFSKNIAERFVIDAVLAAWMSCLLVFPMGLLLTWGALQDATLNNFSSVFRLPLVVRHIQRLRFLRPK